MPDACGCYVDKGKLTMQCEYHKRREKLIVNRAGIYLESRIRQVFSDTYLREMEDKVLEEVRKLRDADKSQTKGETKNAK